jgi:ABC-type lipoprotein export system ATPase subunit
MSDLLAMPLDRLLATHACVGDFFDALGLRVDDGLSPQLPLGEWLDCQPDECFFDVGMERGQMLDHIRRLIVEVAAMEKARQQRVGSLTLIGGRDKAGGAEDVRLTVGAGEVVCIVGPTGSGKSRLLADIECLAQGDTPTGRQILLDEQVPLADYRTALDRKPVAQLSQNMNFVVDMSVGDFITMHARCRQGEDSAVSPEEVAERVIACANELTGERFSSAVSVTQLSGGQTRALMIADAALLSASPVVLIDEIENAGVDRKRALDLLVNGEKIVFISTHDPLLALRGSRRLVIRNGGIAEIIATSDKERQNLAYLESLDATLMGIRDRLRRGQRIEEDLPWQT